MALSWFSNPLLHTSVPCSKFEHTWILCSSNSEDSLDGTERNAPSHKESNRSNLEKTWRYVKRPLLRIGGKGITLTHGNSLRELLQAHTVVKVKVNSPKYGKITPAIVNIYRIPCG
jgi:hypothetical protein